MTLFIGVEGIGLRNSVAVLANHHGEIEAASRLVGQPLALHVTKRHVFRTRLFDLIRDVLDKTGRRLDDLKDAVLCIGLTGVSFPYDALVDLPNEFHKAQLNVRHLICTGHVEIAFASHVLATKGSAIISNAGTAALVSTSDDHFRYGGWGPVFGAEGSGYWIGTQVLRAISEGYDSGSPDSRLWSEVNDWLSGPSDAAIPEWTEAKIAWKALKEVYRAEGSDFDLRTALFGFTHRLSLQDPWILRPVLSGLTIPLMRAWDADDAHADAIVGRAVGHLTRLYRGALSRAGAHPDVGPLVLYGGVFTHNPRFRDFFISELKVKDLAPSSIVWPGVGNTLRPVCGALLYALGNSLTLHLRLPSSDIIKTVSASAAQLAFTPSLVND